MVPPSFIPSRIYPDVAVVAIDVGVTTNNKSGYPSILISPTLSLWDLAEAALVVSE